MYGYDRTCYVSPQVLSAEGQRHYGLAKIKSPQGANGINGTVTARRNADHPKGFLTEVHESASGKESFGSRIAGGAAERQSKEMGDYTLI